MPHSKLLFLFIAVLVSSFALAAQQTSTRTTQQAQTVVLRAIAAMGGTVPVDSKATGTVTTVAGSLTETGNIVIRTRGTSQTREDIQTTNGSSLVFSNGKAGLIDSTSIKTLQLELAVTAQSPDFPLALLASALSNPDTAYAYIGLETSGGSSLHHIQFWNSFASNPDLQTLAPLSVRDVWIDAASGLPQKISYVLHYAQGAVAGIPVDVLYADYRNISGLLYPFSIQKSLNGTPWATITIQNVVLNAGLTDADFPTK